MLGARPVIVIATVIDVAIRMGTRARGGSWESAANGDDDNADEADDDDNAEVSGNDDDDDDEDDDDNDDDDDEEDDDKDDDGKDIGTPLVISAGNRSAACASCARSVVRRWRANAARWRFSSSTRATSEVCGDA